MLIFPFARAKNAQTGFGCETSAKPENKKLQTSQTKNGVKFDEPPKQLDGLASSFSLRRSASNVEADEHNQTGILTSASNLVPPSRSFDQWTWNL